MQYYDYTILNNHRERVWSIGEWSLSRINGLDLGAAVGSVVAAGVAALVAVMLTILLPINSMVIGILAFLAAMYLMYRQLTKEDREFNPAVLARSLIVAQLQPRHYGRGMDTDEVADRMYWQVIFWRPDWAEVRLGNLRRWTTYNPAPISEETRRELDITGAGEFLGWNHITAIGAERADNK